MTYQQYLRTVLIGKTLLTIFGVVIGACAATAGVIWLIAMLIHLCTEGLQMLVSSWQQLTALSNGTPVLHFFFQLVLVCLCIRVAFWLVKSTALYIKKEVRYVK
ncbi:MAG TPA: hypothetical protein VL461_11565 [Dictyobacter sp.]|jgi:hypothetical protein|nr:hypothetical protein [Dictyobacter sp.]